MQWNIDTVSGLHLIVYCTVTRFFSGKITVLVNVKYVLDPFKLSFLRTF